MTHINFRGLFIFVVFRLLSGLDAKNIPAFAGPYIAIVEKILSCDESATDGKWTISAHTSHYNRYKPSEKQIVTGNVTHLFTFDDSTWVSELEVRIAIRSNNEWKKNAFVLKFPDHGCTRFRTFLPSMFKVMYRGLGQGGVCSVPPGVYAFDDPVDWSFPNVPAFPYGHYLSHTTGGRAGSGNISMCSKFEMRIIPKHE